MIIKNRVLLFFYITLLCIKCTGHSSKPTYSDIYDLNFTMKSDSLVVYPWLENAAYSNNTLNGYIDDSSIRPLYTKWYLKGFPFINRLKTENEQRILLPIHKKKEGRIDFESKGENIKYVSLLIDGLNSEETILFSDTLTFVPDTNLNTVSKKIPLTNVELLKIRIYVEGEPEIDARISYSKLIVRIGNKSIDEYPVRELPAMTHNSGIDIIPIDFVTKEGCDKIAVLNNSKIIGLGESIHGNSNIKNFAYDFVFEAVESHNCKLVITEMPMENSFSFNRYIYNDEYIMDSTLVIQDEMQQLLDNLQKYNLTKTSDEKVRLFGMDYNTILSTNQSTAITIFDFITHLNRELELSVIDKLAVLLMEEDWNKAIHFLQENKSDLQALLTLNEIESMYHILALSQSMGTDGIQRFIARDSIMFVNTTFLLNQFLTAQNSKAIVYGHAAHINPVSTYPAVPSKPFGAYMKEAFNDEYSPLLILTGQGNSIAYDNKYNISDSILHELPMNSAELFLNSYEKDLFYLPISSDFDKLLLSRFKGSHHISQEFFPYNLYQRYKGLFFVNSSINTNQAKDISFDEVSERFISKNKDRAKVLDTIKKRIGE